MTRDRRTYLGGHDVGAILGLDPWRSPYAVWLAKTSPDPEPEQGQGDWWQGSPSEAAWWGTRSERAILDAYTLRTGREVVPGRLVESVTDDPELAGTPDGFVGPDLHGLVEAKTIGEQAWRACGDELPDRYRAQALYYLGITGNDYCDVAARIGGNRLELIRLVADDYRADIDLMLDYAHRWWHAHVAPDVAPEIDGNRATREALERRWGRHVAAERIDLTEEWREVLAERHRTHALLRDLEADRERLDCELIAALGGATDAYLPGADKPSWTWRPVIYHRDQAKAIREAHEAGLPPPDGVTADDLATAVRVLDAYRQTTEARRLDTKAPRRKKDA